MPLRVNVREGHVVVISDVALSMLLPG